MPSGLGAGVRPGAALAGADRGGDHRGDRQHHHRQRRRALRAGLRQLRGQREHRGGDAKAAPGGQQDPIYAGLRLQLRPAEPAGGVRRGGYGVYLRHGRVRQHHRAHVGRGGRGPDAQLEGHGGQPAHQPTVRRRVRLRRAGEPGADAGGR